MNVVINWFWQLTKPASCSNPLRTGILNMFFLCFKQGWKKPGFLKKKPAQWVFLGFFGFFWVFLVFLGFFGFFAQKRGFLGFFPVSRILLGASRL